MDNSILMNSTASLKAQQSAKEYEILIHAISHEHTKSNIDRHVLVLEKWLRDYTKGFFLRDLTYIIKIMQLLNERLISHTELFQPILNTLLKVCSKPLYEAKANERLREEVQANMRAYYSEIASFWEICDARTRINLAGTFRTIVNGGVDPRILKVDIVPYLPEDDRTPVIDKVLNQTLLRDSCVVDVIVKEFLNSVSQLKSVVGDAAIDAASYMPTESMVLLGLGDKKDDEGDNDTKPLAPATNNDDSDDDDEEVFNNQLQASTSIVDGSGQKDSLNEPSSAIMSKTDESAIYAESVLAFMNLCYEMGEYPESALRMCDEGICFGLTDMLAISAKENLRDERVHLCLDLIWTCLEIRIKTTKIPLMKSTNGGAEVRRQLKNMKNIINFSKIVPVLRNLVLRLLFEGYRLADKECRNEVIILLTLCVNFPQSIPAFLSCDLISSLVTYACLGEAGVDSWTFFDESIPKMRNFFTVFDVDIQFKASLWMLLQDLIDTCDPDILCCIGSSPLLDILLRYTEADSTDEGRKLSTTKPGVSSPGAPGEDIGTGGSLMFSNAETNSLLPYPREIKSYGNIPDFPPLPGNEPLAPGPPKDYTYLTNFFNSLPITELRSLQVLAMNMLSKTSTVLMGEFLRIDGPLRILEVIHRYADSLLEEHIALIQNALLSQTRCLISNSNTIKSILEKQDFVRICLHIFHTSQEESSRSQSLRLISIMCSDEGIENQRQFRVMDGPRLVVGAMQTFTNDRSIQVGRRAGLKIQGLVGDQLESNGGDAPPLAISMLDVIHKGIIRNRANEAAFAQSEGVDALLDMLETSDFLLRLKVLRVLADLLDNQRLTAYAMAWRSPLSMRPAAQVITHAWLDEEARLSASRDGGVICNIWDALGDHRWPEPTLGRRTMADTASDASLGGINKLAHNNETSNVMKMTEDMTASMAGGGSVSTSVRDEAMNRDTRGVLASILQLLGLLDVAVGDFIEDSGFLDNNDEMVNDYQDNNIVIEDLPTSLEEEKQFVGGFDDNSAALSESRSSIGGSELSVKLVSASEVKLDPSDKQVISLARRYDIIRMGEWWGTVADDLYNNGVKPIEADKFLLEYRLRDSFDAAASVQLEQLELRAELQRLKNAQNAAFVGGILDQKQQQIKAEWLKRKAKTNVNSSMYK